jgi:hypothetical protein
MIRKDLLTGEVFVPQRINQVFAKSANRIAFHAFHNKKANDLRHSAAFINKPLHVNLRILNELMKGKTDKTFHKQFLMGKGFSFSVHNHVNVYEGKNHYALYQYTVVNLGDEQIKIIKND